MPEPLTQPTFPVALLTGSDHSPGRETAMALARAGFKVWAVVPSGEDAAALARAAAGLAVMPVVVDVTDGRDRARAIADIGEVDGRLDLLVLDVATTLEGPLALLSDNEVFQLFDRNVLATFGLVRDALDLLRAAHRGRVIAFSPLSGELAIPGMGAACAARFALDGIFTAWRTELASDGVRLTLLETGPVRSEPARPASLSARAADEVREDGPWRPFITRFLALRLAMMTRALKPDAVADAVVALARAETPPHHAALGGLSRARRLLQALLPGRAMERIMGAVFNPGLGAPPRPEPTQEAVRAHQPARPAPRWGGRPRSSPPAKA
jgi:NAD(P)-dependent dehydrogenase (short-subunit alcohol dehydrogenase family)